MYPTKRSLEGGGIVEEKDTKECIRMVRGKELRVSKSVILLNDFYSHATRPD